MEPLDNEEDLSFNTILELNKGDELFNNNVNGSWINHTNSDSNFNLKFLSNENRSDNNAAVDVIPIRSVDCSLINLQIFCQECLK